MGNLDQVYASAHHWAKVIMSFEIEEQNSIILRKIKSLFPEKSENGRYTTNIIQQIYTNLLPLA